MRRPVALLVALGGLAGLIGAGGCGSRSSSSIVAIAPTSTSPAVTSPAVASSAVCGAAHRAETSLNSVTQLNVSTVGGGGAQVALQSVSTSATSLADAAQTQFGPEVEALRHTIGTLQSTVAGLSAQPDPSAQLGAINTAVGDVRAAVQTLLAKARAVCPSPSPGPAAPTRTS